MNDQKLVLFALAVYYSKLHFDAEEERLGYLCKPLEFYFERISERSGVVVEDKNREPMLKWICDQLDEKK